MSKSSRTATNGLCDDIALTAVSKIKNEVSVSTSHIFGGFCTNSWTNNLKMFFWAQGNCDGYFLLLSEIL